MELISNKRGSYNYEILDTYQAGILLQGTEVKSLRNHRGSLIGSFVALHNGELWLRKSFIPPYQEKNAHKSYNPNRDRKLLLKSTEQRKLAGALQGRGYTILPLAIYSNEHNHKITVTIGLARHANKSDKRQKLRARDTERELSREVKGRIRV